MSAYTPDSNRIIHNVDVDFKRREIITPIHLVQYDSSLPILAVSLYSNGQTYTVPDNADVSIRLGKSDKTYVYNKSLGYNDDSTIVYFEITQQMTALPGDVKAIIEVAIGGEVAASSYIILSIDLNPVQEDMVESTDEFTTIIEMENKSREYAANAKQSADESETAMNASISAMNSANAAMNSAKTSETNAKTSETNAKTSETNAATSAANAKTSEENAELFMLNAGDSEVAAANSAEIAASYNGARYAECSNLRTELNKTITLIDFELKAGAHVFVKFTDTGTSDPSTSGYFTLNVNETGDKQIYFSGPNYNPVPAGSSYFFSNDRCEEFLYDGERWLWVNYGYNSDTKNTTGTTNKADTKLFLAGATSQETSPSTYSNSGCYIGTDNELYSNGKKVLTGEGASSLYEDLGNYGLVNVFDGLWTQESPVAIVSTNRMSASGGDIITFLYQDDMLQAYFRFYDYNGTTLKTLSSSISNGKATFIAPDNTVKFTAGLMYGGGILVEDIYDTARVYVNNKFTELESSIDSINSNLFNKIYPIGSIYMSVSPTNPSTLFGGTWVAWGSGRVPVGVNTNDGNFNTVEKTGGESTHTLTVNEIPSHDHGGNTSTNGGHSHLIRFSFASSGSDRRALAGSGVANDTRTDDAGSHNHTISKQGGGNAHNNLQPYITCYMWKRTD